MKRVILLTVVVLCHLAVSAVAAEQEPPPRRSVTLPLSDYLALLEQVQSVEEAARLAETRREPNVFELTSQTASIVWPDDDSDYVDVTSTFEVLFQGDGLEPVALPLTGLAATAAIEPAVGASLRTTECGLELTASEPGRYRVRVESRARIEESRGTRFLAIAPRLAAVGELELDLPVTLKWAARGAVTSREAVSDTRRVLGLTLPRGEGTKLEVRRDVEGDEDEKVLADVAIATIIELSDDGVLRHDVIRYHVSRGALARFSLTLPERFVSRRLVTDEGDAPLLIQGRLLSVVRKELLEGEGFAVLSSQPTDLSAVPLDAIETTFPVRERFLVLSSSIPADVEPWPSARFRRIDVIDVPAAIRGAVGVDFHAAWRARDASAERMVLRVTRKPTAETLPTVVRERRSLMLLTKEGMLVNRDTFTLQTSATTFEVTLPSAAKLWSSRVNGTWVRAVERDGRVLVPLGFGAEGDEVVEIVTVSELAVPERKAQLGLTLGEVAAPVLRHDWKLLLPERNEYRYRAGDLRPVAVRYQPRLEREEESEGPRASALGPGGLSGMRVRVCDDTGAVLPGATVTLNRLETGRVMTAVTNEVGQVWFRSLPGGSYALEADLAGFQSARFESFFLESGETPAYRITMPIATISETITVTGEAPLIDTRSAGITTTFRAGGRGAASGSGSGRGGSFRESKSELSGDERRAFRGEVEGLRAGLTGGVKPIPVNIPEQGKLLSLSGALPPARVSVTLDVKPD